MNNKIKLTFSGALPTFDVANLALWQASAIDELLIYSNNVNYSDEGGNLVLEVDTDYIPEQLQDFAPNVTEAEQQVRQDVKRLIHERLPRVTIGEGLLIWSQNDVGVKYFVNSVKIDLGANGIIRYGIANFTSDQATDPFTDASIPLNNWFFSFFNL
jgi:hypothetical protein